MNIDPRMFLIGCIVACSSLILFFLKRMRYGRWAKASGKVIELIRRENFDSGSVTFSPRLSFCTAEGETMEFVSSVSSFPGPAVGQILPVLYNPRNPREAVVDRFMFRHLAELVMFSLGLALVLVYVFQRFGTRH